MLVQDDYNCLIIIYSVLLNTRIGYSNVIHMVCMPELSIYCSFSFFLLQNVIACDYIAVSALMDSTMCISENYSF